MCRGQCTKREAILACLHVATVLFSIGIAAFLAVNKIEQATSSCPYTQRYDDTIYESVSSLDVLCDTGLYWALISAALSFLFVMVNWVAGVHKSLKWQRVQFVLTFVGMAGTILATVINTSGMVLWCQNLIHQRHAEREDFSHFPGPIIFRPQSCYKAAVVWDDYKKGSEKVNKAVLMYNMVIPAEAFQFVITILWQIMAPLTCYVTYYRIQEYKANLLAMEADDSEDESVGLVNAGPSDAHPAATNTYPHSTKLPVMA